MTWAVLASSQGLPDRLDPSVLDSDRFGLRIGRLELGAVGDAEPEAVVALFLRSGLDLLVLRYPVAHADWFARLLSPDVDVLHTDTLVYYRKAIEHVTPPPFAVTRGTAADAALVRDLVLEGFADYQSHYRADPLLDEDAALAGYVAWATSFLDGDGRTLMVLRDDDAQPVAWAGLRLTPPSEIVLGGVCRHAAGRGVYSSILAGAESIFADLGERECWISTQVHNLPVIRTWASNGYRFEAGFNTVHLVAGGARQRLRESLQARRRR